AGLSEADLHKLSTATGLMARVSRVDPSSSTEELNVIAQALQSYWSISAEVARIAAEATLSGISLDTDPLRLAQEMLDITAEEERTRFMDVLFAVAAADGFVSQDEMSEIGSIASWLYLPRKTFIAAKVKIPAEQRAE
ncbi:MAG TPA: TerB family tellurite resistance protein, partial [Anaerolineae bacterium]|nr:TerB family tellurite resistance protein [Anaerolineae bacterium]